MTAAVVALAAAVVLLTVLVVGLLRSHAEILRALHELGAGLELDRKDGPVPVTLDSIASPRRLPAVDTPHILSGETLDGDVVALPLVGRGDTLVAFLSSGCTTCQGFWSAFAGEVEVPGHARLVVVTRGADEESPSELRQRAPAGVPLVLSSEAWDRFEVPGSPYFAYVDATGRVVGEGSGASWPQVVQLMTQARADDAERAAARTRGSGAIRQGRDDGLLAAAGIRPGDPSLHLEPS